MKRFLLAAACLGMTLSACGADRDTSAPEAADETPAAVAAPAPQTPAPAPVADSGDSGAPAEPPMMLAQNDEGPVRFREGQHYKTLTPAQPTSSPPDKIEVAEVFWYGCPHCNAFEPYVQKYLARKPDNVSFVRIHAAMNRNWQIHARLFYTMELLGVVDDLHEKVFAEIHKNHNRLDTPEKMEAFLAKNGVAPADFRKTFESFAVENKLKRAETLARRYRLSSVPSIVVNGKYTTGAGMAGGNEELLDVIDYLVDKEAERN